MGPSRDATSAIVSNTTYIGARGIAGPSPSVFVTLSVQKGSKVTHITGGGAGRPGQLCLQSGESVT